MHHSKPIVFVSPLPPPFGGIATLTAQLQQYGLPDKTPVKIIDSRILGTQRNIFDKQQFSFAEMWRNLRIPSALFFQLLRRRPRLVHINSSISTVGVLRDLMCAILAKLCFVPVVVQYHANMPDFNREKLLGLSGKALDALMRIANLNILTNAPSWKCVAHKTHLRKTALPNPIAEYLFDQPTAPPLTNPVRILSVGGLTKAKGILEILALAKANPTIEFHLYGKAQAETKINEFEACPNIILHHEVKHETLLQEMSQYHILLFPSHTEGFPLTILEAMALGLPIIASNVGAIPEMVDDEKGGILCAPKDVTGFQQALDRMLADVNLTTSMGAYNRQKCFDHYRYSKVIADLMQCYREWGV